jgi:hypothetical protein
MSGYTAHILSEKIKEALLGVFEPRFETVKAHHITHRFGVDGFEDLKPAKEICVTHYIYDPNGIEALAVTIDGQSHKPDGLPYHITWSLNKEAGFSAKDANDLVERALNGDFSQELEIKLLDFKIPAEELTASFISADKTEHALECPKKSLGAPKTPKP